MVEREPVPLLVCELVLYRLSMDMIVRIDPVGDCERARDTELAGGWLIASLEK